MGEFSLFTQIDCGVGSEKQKLSFLEAGGFMSVQGLITPLLPRVGASLTISLWDLSRSNGALLLGCNQEGSGEHYLIIQMCFNQFTKVESLLWKLRYQWHHRGDKSNSEAFIFSEHGFVDQTDLNNLARMAKTYPLSRVLILK